MDLTKHVPKRGVIPELKAQAKTDVLRELSWALLSGKNRTLRESTLEQLVGRESLESTALGRGIALPHARVPGLNDLICAIGVSKKGIDFRAVDDERVHVVFLMLYPPGQQTLYLNFVAGLVRALAGSDRSQAMRDSTDADGVLEVLRQGVGESVEAEQAAVGKKASVDTLDVEGMAGGELFLLARLELCTDMLNGAKRGKTALKARQENIRALVSSRLLQHYDRLKKRGGPALVTFEGDVCQGCSVKLPSQQAQRIYRDTKTVARCGNCQRFLYPI